MLRVSGAYGDRTGIPLPDDQVHIAEGGVERAGVRVLRRFCEIDLIRGRAGLKHESRVAGMAGDVPCKVE